MLHLGLYEEWILHLQLSPMGKIKDSKEHRLRILSYFEELGV